MAALRRLFAMLPVGLVLGVSSAAAQGGTGNLESTVGSVRQQIRASWTAETMFRLGNAGGTVPWTGLSFVSVHASASAGDIQMKLVPGQVDLGHFTPRPGTGDNVV